MPNSNNSTSNDPSSKRTGGSISAFAKAAEEASQPKNLCREGWEFLRHNKKWWLAPIIILLLLLGLLLAFGGSAAAPFLYPLF